MKLSILMPVYNEAQFVQSAIKAVLDCEYPCAIELVVVDDASTDGSAEIIDGVQDERLVKLRHPVNRGKGGAVRTAVAAATGDYCVLFDADLEYRPEDIPRLLEPALTGEAEVVRQPHVRQPLGLLLLVCPGQQVRDDCRERPVQLLHQRLRDLPEADADEAVPRPEHQVQRLRHGRGDHLEAAGTQDQV